MPFQFSAYEPNTQGIAALMLRASEARAQALRETGAAQARAAEQRGQIYATLGSNLGGLGAKALENIAVEKQQAPIRALQAELGQAQLSEAKLNITKNTDAIAAEKQRTAGLAGYMSELPSIMKPDGTVDHQAGIQLASKYKLPDIAQGHMTAAAAEAAEKRKPFNVAEGASVTTPGRVEQGLPPLVTGAPKPKTQAQLAVDAADPNSPTQQHSAAALAALQQTPAAQEAARHNKELERIAALNAGRESASQRETARHNKAMEDAANPLGAMGGAAVPPVPSPTTPGERNETYLQSLPAAQAQLVKGLAEGRFQFPTGNALRSPYWQGVLQAVGQYDPSFDAVNYNARSKTRADFTSGKSSQTVNALNTVAQHLDRLSKSADALNNSWSPMYNSVANFLSRQSGSKVVTNFETDKKAVVDELTRAWRQAGGSEGDIKSWSAVLDAANSPDQLHSAIGEMGQLLEGKLQALENQYQQGMGTDKITVITPSARDVLSRLEQKAGTPQKPATTGAPAENTEGVVNGRAAIWKTVNGVAGWYAK